MYMNTGKLKSYTTNVQKFLCCTIGDVRYDIDNTHIKRICIDNVVISHGVQTNYSTVCWKIADLKGNSSLLQA